MHSQFYKYNLFCDRRCIQIIITKLKSKYLIINKKRLISTAYQRTGKLWEGRYKATLIDSEAYLLTCMCYIELNLGGLAWLSIWLTIACQVIITVHLDNPVIWLCLIQNISDWVSRIKRVRLATARYSNINFLKVALRKSERQLIKYGC